MDSVRPLGERLRVVFSGSVGGDGVGVAGVSELSGSSVVSSGSIGGSPRVAAGGA